MDQFLLQSILLNIQGESEDERYAALLELRQKFNNFNPPISSVMEAGLITILVNRLETESFRNQTEITWILINVAFGSPEQSYSIVEAGGVPKLIRLMKSGDSKVATQSAWVLSNLCGDGTENRDVIIGCGAVPVLAELLDKAVTLELEMVQTFVWLCLNMTRFSSVQMSSVQMLFQPMLNLLVQDDRKTLVDTCWFFTNLINLNRNVPRAVIRNILMHFNPLFDRDNLFVMEAALRCIIAIALRRSVMQNDEVNDAGILSKVVAMILHEKFTLSRLATMCCRHLAFASSNGIQQLMDHNIIENLCQLFEGEQFYWKSKREGIRLLENVAIQGSLHQVTDFLENPRLMKGLSNILKTPQLELLQELLMMLSQFSEEQIPDSLLEMFRQTELDSNLESLLDHVDESIHNSCFRLLETLFPDKLPYDPQNFGEAEE